ncbi:hypothetical protein CC86DRAFT_185918 [Ophiobolus disseminans]|uniref:Secreted protein n=1 Tax=Ophiobolus disseminans TaxID=1469910 RepID=A0A6A7A7C8_9PLEO|nr:hypothetical protein CC86DRAFT_185918 [Ophiobolus disseminans]
MLAFWIISFLQGGQCIGCLVNIPRERRGMVHDLELHLCCPTTIPHPAGPDGKGSNIRVCGFLNGVGYPHLNAKISDTGLLLRLR